MCPCSIQRCQPVENGHPRTWWRHSSTWATSRTRQWSPCHQLPCRGRSQSSSLCCLQRGGTGKIVVMRHLQKALALCMHKTTSSWTMALHYLLETGSSSGHLRRHFWQTSDYISSKQQAARWSSYTSTYYPSCNQTLLQCKGVAWARDATGQPTHCIPAIGEREALNGKLIVSKWWKSLSIS